MLNTKIVCAFHPKAPEQLAQTLLDHDDVYVPILAGAARYKKGTSKLFDTFAKDNDGDNISDKNYYAGEITPIYWIYRHYRDLGNPDMIGFCHYRRFLDLDFEHLRSDTIYCHRLKIIGNSLLPYASVYDLFVNIKLDEGWSGLRMNSQIFSLFQDLYWHYLPSYGSSLEYVLQDQAMFDKNLFVMSRQEFFRYMEYALQCYRVILSQELEDRIREMFADAPDQLKGWLYTRCRSHFNEISTAVYLEHRRQQGAKLEPRPYTEESFAKY